MNYEQRKRSETKDALERALDAENFEEFEQEYRDRGLRYLSQRDREPLMRRYLRLKHQFNNRKEQTMTFEEAYDMALELGICSEETLQIVTDINGNTVEAINDIVHVTTGYQDLEQYANDVMGWWDTDR